jgi:hypothetical protein
VHDIKQTLEVRVFDEDSWVVKKDDMIGVAQPVKLVKLLETTARCLQSATLAKTVKLPLYTHKHRSDSDAGEIWLDVKWCPVVLPLNVAGAGLSGTSVVRCTSGEIVSAISTHT